MMHKKRSGFSLIEMIVVIGLIAGIVAVVMPRIMQLLGKAKYRTNGTILNQLKEGILQFDTDLGRVPREQEGLKVLFETNGDPKWRGHYSTVETEDGRPLDGWKNPIDYHAPAKVNKKYKRYELISYGGENKNESNSEEKDWIIDGE